MKLALRRLAKSPGFTSVAVLTLTLGIGGVTTQFSIVDAVLLRGLPFPEPERLVRLTVREPTWGPERERNPWISDVLEINQQTQAFEGLAPYIFAESFIVTIADTPQRISGCRVAPNFFSLLGVMPALGRAFNDADNRREAEPVTIISDALWKSDFAHDPHILGRSIRLNGRPTTIVGVMPPEFQFPRDQMWTPIFSEYAFDHRPGYATPVLARLKPGISLAQAHTELEGFLQRFATQYPATNENLTGARLEPLVYGFVGRGTRQAVLAMLFAVAAVLVIACANVMNMQFARAVVRTREFAVRSALGASRGRLVRELLADSLILASLGAVGGVLLATWALDLLAATVLGSMPVRVLPSWWQLRIDGRVLAFTVGATALSVILSGLLPAVFASRASLLDAMKAGARGQTSGVVRRFMSALVVGQVALTCALLIGSLLQIRSVQNQLAVDFGYDLDAVLAGRMNFSAGYEQADARRDVQRRLLLHLRGHPDFTQAAFTTRRNMMTNDSPQTVMIDGRAYARPEEYDQTWVEVVSDGYFALLGLQPIAGREFEPGDRDQRRHVALVNESFARKHFGADSPIGRRIRRDEQDTWRTIVGVVPDTLMQGPFEQQRDGAGIFISSEDWSPPYVTLVVRGHTPPAQLSDVLRREIARVDPNLAIYHLNTARGLFEIALTPNRLVASLFTIFAGVAVTLAVVGLYGVTAFAVSRRTQELGIRIALGAAPGNILRLVLRQGCTQLAIGALLGVGMTLLLVHAGDRALSNFLYRVDPRDPVIYGGVVLLLAIATAIACLVPARRATRVDPLVALRAE